MVETIMKMTANLPVSRIPVHNIKAKTPYNFYPVD